MKLGTKLGRCKYPSVCFDLHIRGARIDDVIWASHDQFVLKKFNFFASSGIIQETFFSP